MNRYHHAWGVNFECRQGVSSGCRLTADGLSSAPARAIGEIPQTNQRPSDYRRGDATAELPQLKGLLAQFAVGAPTSEVPKLIRTPLDPEALLADAQLGELAIDHRVGKFPRRHQGPVGSPRCCPHLTSPD